MIKTINVKGETLKSTKLLILDVDGTLLDVRKRYLQSFKLVAPKANPQAIFALRARGVKAQEILAKTLGFNDLRANALRMKLMNSPKLLDLDSLLPNVLQFLKIAREKGFIIVACSLRNKEHILKQLKRFGILRYFDSVFTHSYTKNSEELKKELFSCIIKKYGIKKGKVVVIGDAVEELKAAKVIGVLGFAVATGLTSECELARYGQVFRGLSEILECLEFKKLYEESLTYNMRGEV